MAYANRELTKEQRETLKPTFQNVETAIDALDKALTGIRPRPNDDEIPGDGICGTGCGCSSFDGPGTSMLDKCRRPFCRHTRLAHTT
jgi:hypothetical protein